MASKTFFVKLFVCMVAAALWWFSYTSINALNARPERAVFFTSRPADLWPGMIQPVSGMVYVGGAAVLLVWPLGLCWRTRNFWKFLAMVSLGTSVGFAIFLVWPLNIRRPEFTGSSFGEALMRGVFSVDQSANCFPSFHSFFAILGALVVTTLSARAVDWLLAWILATAVLISTVTTGQHYVLDVLGGAAIAILSFCAMQSNSWSEKRELQTSSTRTSIKSTTRVAPVTDEWKEES